MGTSDDEPHHSNEWWGFFGLFFMVGFSYKFNFYNQKDFPDACIGWSEI